MLAEVEIELTPIETTLRLAGWTREWRVVLVRETPARAPVEENGKRRRGKDRQEFLPHAQGAGWDAEPFPVMPSGLSAILQRTGRDNAESDPDPRDLRSRSWEEIKRIVLASARL